jgi:uncharacterized repeat protein (TIGR03803 family)
MLLVAFLFCTVIGSLAQSTFFTSLASLNDIGNPYFMSLVQGTDGNFYGTTWVGGAYGDGTVFKVTPIGTLTTLHDFCSQPNCADGWSPYSGLVQGSDGSFYGATVYGGNYNCYLGCGTIYKITPAGALTTVYSFDGSQGTYPAAPPVQGRDGNFYGTTMWGGTYGAGTVFKLTPSGTLTTLHNFDGSENEMPLGALVQATDGNFYGTTRYGGGGNNCDSDSCGSIFKITSSGTLTTVHSFDGSDGWWPFAGLVQATDGNFYGTTIYGGSGDCYGFGCGTIFKITPAGTLTTLYSFQDSPDGYWPTAGLVQASDGNFYGTTAAGGTYGDATVFEITAAGTLTTLHNFNGSDGSGCNGGLVQAADGNFYGTTYGGGANGGGTVFRLGLVRTCATCRP